jgi:hypothetical protein
MADDAAVQLFAGRWGTRLAAVSLGRCEEVINEDSRVVFKAGAACVAALVHVAHECLGVDDEAPREGDDANDDDHEKNPGHVASSDVLDRPDVSSQRPPGATLAEHHSELSADVEAGGAR